MQYYRSLSKDEVLSLPDNVAKAFAQSPHKRRQLTLVQSPSKEQYISTLQCPITNGGAEKLLAKLAV